MLSRSKGPAFWLSVSLAGAYGDLLACKDIGRENGSMLSQTLIFRNFHLVAWGADRWRQVPQPTPSALKVCLPHRWNKPDRTVGTA
jgi:hypothetical protein